MPTIILPTSLRSRAAGHDRVEVGGSTIGECLTALEREHPNLKGWVLDDQGRIRTHVNVFVGDARAALDRTAGENDEIYVLQAISGGSS